MDTGFPDVDFAGCCGISHVMNVGGFEYERLVVKGVESSQIDKWRFHIDDDLFSYEFFNVSILH